MPWDGRAAGTGQSLGQHRGTGPPYPTASHSGSAASALVPLPSPTKGTKREGKDSRAKKWY